ncbi:hypothetical protein R70723_10070 [Paenibacillus sp. FSL R7-0273]|uniref:hypothetical protein n=1 Tax=Paenibacillus sp. FSL R7-0273 TaxID=1536772 RepID=UPI0004F88432|nr:hypothetical protein [Paenibacillus sp. FSL R7-0273]AIQ46192.1 hypothetical protein R70723_10070 [Paenibacillus sp. FSL R7-0273]OMF84972.1 hypothetical protein BK144_28880 [Paenibacillus sp. FSL R7-0273]
MPTALTTFQFKGNGAKVIDLELSLSLTAGQCLELLKQASWLPDDWEFKCEVSSTGEAWAELGLEVLLADVIQGDGSIIRILPY